MISAALVSDAGDVPRYVTDDVKPAVAGWSVKLAQLILKFCASVYQSQNLLSTTGLSEGWQMHKLLYL